MMLPLRCGEWEKNRKGQRIQNEPLSLVQLFQKLPALGVWWIQVIMVSDPLILQVSNLTPEILQGPVPCNSAGGAWVTQPSILLCTLVSPLLLINKIHKHQNKVNHELIHLISIQNITHIFGSFTNPKYYIIVSNNTKYCNEVYFNNTST